MNKSRPRPGGRNEGQISLVAHRHRLDRGGTQPGGRARAFGGTCGRLRHSARCAGQAESGLQGHPAGARQGGKATFQARGGQTRAWQTRTSHAARPWPATGREAAHDGQRGACIQPLQRSALRQLGVSESHFHAVRGAEVDRQLRGGMAGARPEPLPLAQDSGETRRDLRHRVRGERSRGVAHPDPEEYPRANPHPATG